MRFIFSVVLVCLMSAVVRGFSPSARVFGVKTARLDSGRSLSQQSRGRVEAVKMVSPSAVLAAPVMYSMMSANEYITHRWYQHAEMSKVGWWKALGLPKIKGGGHVEHHAETRDDMSLKLDDPKWVTTPAAKSLDSDKYRGTAFTWLTSAIMTLQMTLTSAPIFTLLMGFSLKSFFVMLMPSMLLHTLVWNCLHPNMHGLPDIPITEGPPARALAFLRNSAYFKWLYTNHEGHHVVGGQGNYNVCCPGTDHVLGTFVKEEDWRPRQAASLAKLNKPTTPEPDLVVS